MSEMEAVRLVILRFVVTMLGLILVILSASEGSRCLTSQILRSAQDGK